MAEEEHMSSCCLALQAVCASVQTMLGPTKSLKCYISHEGDSGILGDTLQVLDSLMSSYTEHDRTPPSFGPHLSRPLHKPHPGHAHPPPALQLLHECCHEHQTRVGCGVTTLICLTAYWGSEILDLVQQAVPLPVVFAMFREALNDCIKCIDALLIKPPQSEPPQREPPQSEPPRRVAMLPQENNLSKQLNGTRKWNGIEMPKKRSKVLSFSRHFSSKGGCGNVDAKPNKEPVLECSEDILRSISKKLAGGRELAMKLALDALSLDGRLEKSQQSSASNGLPLHYEMVGKSEKQSRVVKGVVSTLHGDMLTVAGTLIGRKLKILLLSGDCTPYSKHLGLQKRAGQVTSHDLSVLWEESQETGWLTASMAAISEFEIDVVAVSGSVWPSLWQQCIGVGVLVLKDVPSNSCKTLERLSGTRPITYLTQCSQKSVGEGISVEVLESGWTRSRGSGVGSGTDRGLLPAARIHCCRLFNDSFSSPSVGLSPPQVLTALLCGESQYAVDNLVHQFTNCWRRLCWASEGLVSLPCTPTSTLQVVPGAGICEAACIRKLEEVASGRHLQDDVDISNSKLPLYFTSSWVNNRFILETNHWKERVYQSFANGLRKYLVRCILNSQPVLSLYEAWAEAERKIQGKVEGTAGEGPGSWTECDVLDVATSKREAWCRAVHLLETIFLSKRVH